MGAMPSPITGHSGNIEYLVHARTPGYGGPSAERPIEEILEAAVAESHPGASMDAAPLEGED